jgi:hypothetical protein
VSTVPYALGNHAAIDTEYQRLSVQGTNGTQWETPTGHVINRLAAELAADVPDPPGQKYILLVTDGNPNTCRVGDPQCGQDLSLKAVQDAYTAGVGTFVIGIGDIVANNAGCNAGSTRCGVSHLQDVANAGRGLPVQAPPETYCYEQCVVMETEENCGPFSATYAAAGETPGNAPYFTATTAEELRSALTALLTDVISCTVDMDAIVTGDPSLGEVSIAGNDVGYGDANGWTLETNNFQVTLQGSSCDTFRGGAELNISFPCDPNGDPIAVRR